MKANGKFSFRWSEFELQRNIELKEIRDSSDLFDVTIACDDDQVGAHKLMLSAGSKFFQKILQKTQSSHPFLYIRGCKVEEMKSILDFLYYGEASVEQGDVQNFMSLAQDLQIKGFEISDYIADDHVYETESQKGKSKIRTQIGEIEEKPSSKPTQSLYEFLQTSSDHRKISIEQEVNSKNLETQSNNTVQVDPINLVVVEDDEQNESNIGTLDLQEIDDDNSVSEQSATLIELDGKRENIAIKIDENKYQCEVCWKTYTTKGHLKMHADVHFPDYTYPCKYCGKMFKVRETLRAHTRHHRRNNEKKILSYLPEVIFHKE